MSETIHFTVLDDLTEHIRVELGDAVLAESERVVLLRETYKDREYPGVMYFPRADVNMKLFSKVDGFHTTCPIKGVAIYYDLQGDTESTARKETIEQAAWSYEDPMPEHTKIKAYIAFDFSKFKPEIIRS